MQKLVVVGNGMAGVACVEQILHHAPKFQITIFGDETHVNYNRILLSSVLAGEKSVDDIVLNGTDWYEKNAIDLRLGVRIVDVDPVAKTITGDDGSVTVFDKLLLATGSNPLIPSIEEVKKDGVFVFRNLDDTRALLERARPGLKAVVIGGGLLGLEAARGLQVQGCDVTVVHLMETLMERQLDPTGGSYLASKMNQMGITVLLGLSTTKVLGNGHVQGVEFKGGGNIPADLVVIAAGIRPNVTLNLGVRYEWYGVAYDHFGLTAAPVGGPSALFGISGTSFADQWQPGRLRLQQPAQQRESPVTTSGNKVRISCAIISLEPVGHGRDIAWTSACWL